METAARESPRCEVKLVVPRVESAEVQSWLRLHPAGFSPAHPVRRVNNIYFDTLDLSIASATVEGMSERHKLRFRWYGPMWDIAHGAWELKRKRNGVGWKERFPVSTAVSLAGMTWKQIITGLAAGGSPAIELYLRFASWPTLVNRYERSYYVSRDGVVRVTIDRDQAFFDQRLSLKPNLTRRLLSCDDVIVEFKAPLAHYERLRESVPHLPARVTRSSKYVSGLRYIGM